MNEDLIKAAMIEDEEDLREKEAKSTQEEPSDDTADASQDDTTDEVETDDSDDDDSDDSEDKADDSEEKSEPAPVSETEEHKPTRKERREERRQKWLESVRREQRQPESQQTPQQPQQEPEPYTPLDYTKLEEIDEDQLAKDREAYAEHQRRLGETEAAKSERYIAEQESFWTNVSHEATLLTYDPKYEFLNENNPDAFDPDLAADLNEKYLEFVGFDPQRNTVQRTNISYEKFVKKEMAEREAWAERLAADNQRVVEETKATTGVRPGGTRKSGLGKLKPGDISKMSDEEFAKYEADIDKQILSQLGN